MSKRLHFIDRSRALLMFLGIPFHSALMFSSDWGPVQGVTSVFCMVLAQALTAFRMPAFFLIAGYFAAMLLSRSAPGHWLRGRAVRLGIPLLTATVFILPLQMLLAASYVSSDTAGTLATWSGYLGEASQRWVSHLWFLYDLLIYSGLIAAAWPVVSRLASARLPAGLEAHPFVSLGCLVCLAGLPLTLLWPVIGQSDAGWFINKLLRYSVFFLLGTTLYIRRETFERWLEWSWWNAAVVIGVIALTVMLVIDGQHQRYALLAGWGAGIGGSWLVLAAMKRWGNAPNETVTLMVNASLTIYLVHHPIIFALGQISAATPFPAEVEWLAVVLATSLLSLGIYFLVRRAPAVFFLLNGQRPVAPIPTDRRIVPAPLG